MNKRLIAFLLTVVMLIGMIPLTAVNGFAEELNEAYTMEDEYISVSVSKKNGGFTVKTVEGDRLKKSDNNKDLLYHDGEYDTSFLSFKVGEGDSAKEYLFGGKYNGSSNVSVTQAATGDSIEAVWSVDSLTFTQTLSLTNKQSNESGMVSVNVSVKNDSGAQLPVKARLLLDTALGNQDFGYYQYVDNHDHVMITQERLIEGSDNIPTQIYASNDPYSASVMAYTIHTGAKPEKMAIGHWSHLASTLFDFTPSTNLDFTEASNEYYTSDSAYALYYDLGSVASGASSSLNTYYGVFSNYATPAENKVAINLTAPVRLELNDAKTDFVSKVNMGEADFSVAVDFANTKTDNATDLSNIALAVTCTQNLCSLSDQGQTMTGQDFGSATPHIFIYDDLKVGETVNKELFFKAKPSSEAHYERITIAVYDLSQTEGQISDTYKLGERMAYVLLPGSDNELPKLTFAAMTPKIIYSEGTRHLFVTVSNEGMLDNRANWTLKAYSENGKDGKTIPHTNINIKDGVMDVAFTEDMILSTGGWFLQLEWDPSVVGEGDQYLVPPEYAKQSAPELHFTISDDKKYKNDSYGVLAVVEFDGYDATPDKKEYKILSFKSEEDFEEYKENPLTYESGKYGTKKYTEIIFVFKGEFTATKAVNEVGTYYTAVSTKEIKDGVTVVDNAITINDCLEFEDGTLTVYYEDYDSDAAVTTAVCTEFDGKLYTQRARTSVWSGRAVFTKLEQHECNYSLAPYDENGERISVIETAGELNKGEPENFLDEPIYLVWPGAASIGQTLAGLLFNLAYGQMGRMYETDGYDQIEEEIGTVVSFTANLDLSFASKQNDGTPPDTYWGKIQELWRIYNDKESPYKYIDDLDRVMRAKDWKNIDESGENNQDKEVSGSVMVRDVLFGCGKGFVGVNFSVGVAIKNYVTGLPEIEGTISVNTINDWAYGVEGKIDLEAFVVEAEVSFRSKNNVPVPDNFYVFVSGIEPGINVDGLGVCWITGGGGGIKNLYDSLFNTKTVPPLKLLLSVSFDILKVLECEKATLSLGLTGISLSAENVGIKAVPGLTAIRKMGLSLEWYPGIDLRANIVVDLFDTLIYGGGYIVLISPDYKDVFFEMFARASLNVPNSIPIVGGMRIGGVDLGINSEKIWGAVDVLFITLGVTYYWGKGDVDFGSGSKTNPTFPELLGYDDIPVGYDAENDRTLYARIGTNTSIMATNLPDDGSLVMMNVSGASLKSDLENKNHEFNLGTHTGSDALVQVVFDATSLDDAKNKVANEIKIGSTAGANDFGLVLYDGSNLETANANLTYDGETGKANYAFTVTDSAKYNKKWYMATPANTDVIMYNVAAIPEVTQVSGSVNGSDITLNWDGSELSELDQISFYLCENKDMGSDDPEALNPATPDPGYSIGIVSDASKLSAKTETLTIPPEVPSGDYYVRAVYSKSNEVNGVVFSDGAKLSYVNANTPGAAVVSSVRASGDLRYTLEVENDSKTDGYFVSVYNTDGTVTDYEQVRFEKSESGKTTITVGGSYEAEDPEDSSKTKVFGLSSGKSYKVGVTPYKAVASGEGETAVRGNETLTEAIYLPEPVTPTVTFTADKACKIRQVQEAGIKPEGQTEPVYNTVDKKVYTANELTITAAASENVSGTWKIDDGAETAFSATSRVEIPLSELVDGEHTLTVEGAAADGDEFTATYLFTVDTMPPKLVIASPVNGSFFTKDGKVTLTGITDKDALFNISFDDMDISDRKTIEQLGGELDPISGVFSLTVNVPDYNNASSRILKITATDDVGNKAEHNDITLSHGALADIKSVEVMAGGKLYSSGNIPVPPTGINDLELNLVGVRNDGTRFNLTGYNITWDLLTVEGKASLSDTDELSAEALSQGVITGKLAVADSGFRTASLLFGAPAGHTVSVNTTIGGTVTGGGDYEPGDLVTLKATADNGYRFTGWNLVGISGVDTSKDTITFTMPDSGNVVAEASFEVYVPAVTPPQGGGGSIGGASGMGGGSIAGRRSEAGKLVTVKLPDGKTEDTYLPYYYNSNNDKVFAPISAVEDGYVKFIAPQTGYYYFGENGVSFTDIDGIWSEESIMFTANRDILKGVGNNLFDPEAVMDRAMVITVLYRMAGAPTAIGDIQYTDVEANSWYTDAVIWGTNNHIADGYGDGIFGTTDPITREQLCTMIKRFVDYMGYELPTVNDGIEFEDAYAISDWAAEAVDYMTARGLVNGMPGNVFCPMENTTREQCSAVLERMIKAILGTK